MADFDKAASEIRILNNAIMSIQVGLQDLRLGTPERVLSAVRNLHAGVLLLLKARLVELSPEKSDDVLLKQRIEPRLGAFGELLFVGSGRKTVEAEQIRERLQSLGVDVDWARVKALTEERNNIEHYAAKLSNDALRALASNVLVIVRDFTATELKQDPAQLFGAEAWGELIKNKEVYDAERAACLSSLQEVKWPHDLGSAIGAYTCSECASQLVRPVDPEASFEDLDFGCRSCGCEVSTPEFVERALRQHYPHDEYQAVLDGGTDPLAQCPGCESDTYVVDRQACPLCGYELEYTECMVCEEELTVDDQRFEGLCGYHAEPRE